MGRKNKNTGSRKSNNKITQSRLRRIEEHNLKKTVSDLTKTRKKAVNIGAVDLVKNIDAMMKNIKKNPSKKVKIINFESDIDKAIKQVANSKEFIEFEKTFLKNPQAISNIASLKDKDVEFLRNYDLSEMPTSNSNGVSGHYLALALFITTISVLNNDISYISLTSSHEMAANNYRDIDNPPLVNGNLKTQSVKQDLARDDKYKAQKIKAKERRVKNKLKYQNSEDKSNSGKKMELGLIVTLKKSSHIHGLPL